jgi:hypothetical protein
MKNIFFILLLLITAQGYSQKNTYYYPKLNSVEPKIQSAEITEVKTDRGTTNVIYTDSIIDISFSFEPTHIDFILRNNLDERIKIIWDDAVYVGVDEFSVGIFHNGVKLIDRENTQTPTSILGEGKISDIILPKNSVNYSNTFNRWVYNYLFYKVNTAKIKLLLPIQIKDIKTEYIFSFNIDELKLKTKTRFIGDKVYYKSVKNQH